MQREAALMHDIVFALWLFLPAGVANATPIIVSRLPLFSHWKAPLDGNRLFRSRPILGKNKTWRGLVSGMVLSTFVFWLQQQLVAHNAWASSLVQPIPYTQLPTLIVGPLFGLGALGGDAVESFFKRQFSIAPGMSWFPFDQIDYIIGGVLAIAPFVQLNLLQYLLLLAIWLCMHVLVSFVGYTLGLKERPI